MNKETYNNIIKLYEQYKNPYEVIFQSIKNYNLHGFNNSTECKHYVIKYKCMRCEQNMYEKM